MSLKVSDRLPHVATFGGVGESHLALFDTTGETHRVMRMFLEAFWPSRRIDAFDEFCLLAA
jgi:hypothetical protein